MASVKTAISIQENLFEQVETLADELNVSRSRVFVLAVEAFIRQHKNRQLLAAINLAYDDLPDPTEQTNREKMRRQHRDLLEGEW